MTQTLALSRDHTCVRGMNWRFDLPPHLVDALIKALLGLGYQQRPGPAALPALRSPEGHQIMLVRSTGRAQIRVDYTVPETLRRFAAEAIFATVIRALQ